MTNSKAYMAGFCKAAEDIGVDPQVLIKAAAIRGNTTLKHLNNIIRNTPRVVDDDALSILRILPTSRVKMLDTNGLRAAAKSLKAKELSDKLYSAALSLPSWPQSSEITRMTGAPDVVRNNIFKRLGIVERAGRRAADAAGDAHTMGKYRKMIERLKAPVETAN